MTDYDKTQRYFTKENDDIYLKLRPNLTTALQNALALGNYDHKDPTKAVSEMELLFKLLELK